MCSIGAAIGGIGAVLQGSMAQQAANSQAQAAMAQAEYQAAVARQNEIYARQDAEAVSSQAATQEQLLRQQGSSVMASQNAAFGASGAGGLSNQLIQMGTVSEIEFDAALLRDDFGKKITSYNRQAQGYYSEANNALIAGQNKANALKASGNAAMIGGILNAGGLVASKWNSFSSSSSDSSVNKYPLDPLRAPMWRLP